MSFLIFTLIWICGVISADSRLIQKNSTKLSTEASPHIRNPPSRLARAIFRRNTITGLSQEDDSNEYLQSRDPKTTYSPPVTGSKAGIPKASATVVNKTESQEPIDKNKIVLVKKPIPKFVEVDYDDDFQNKVIRSSAKYPDSIEHEDEDFNLDDYDFDINHDEFNTRGKPLEPRLKNKFMLEQQHLQSEPNTRLQAAAVLRKPLPPQKTVIKREKQSKLTKKAAHKLKEDYYDDITSTKKPEPASNASSDEESAEDDSKEAPHKLSRIARESLDTKAKGFKDMGSKFRTINKNTEKSQVEEKLRKYLPMFPTTSG